MQSQVAIMKFLSTFLFLVVVSVSLSLAQADSSRTYDDEQGVYDAVEDYLEGLYQAQPDRIERSVSKDLVKFGYWRQSADEAYAGSPMNFEQLKQLASRWNANNRMKLDDKTPREIVVLDVLDKTAVAKLTAQWGIDYFQLENIDGKWMIRDGEGAKMTTNGTWLYMTSPLPITDELLFRMGKVLYRANVVKAI